MLILTLTLDTLRFKSEIESSPAPQLKEACSAKIAVLSFIIVGNSSNTAYGSVSSS